MNVEKKKNSRHCNNTFNGGTAGLDLTKVCSWKRLNMHL